MWASYENTFVIFYFGHVIILNLTSDISFGHPINPHDGFSPMRKAVFLVGERPTYMDSIDRHQLSYQITRAKSAMRLIVTYMRNNIHEQKCLH